MMTKKYYQDTKGDEEDNDYDVIGYGDYYIRKKRQ